MRRLEEADLLADVGPRSHAEPADLRGAGVREVVAVQVGRGKHVVIGRAREHLLEHAVGNPVVDQDLPVTRRAGPHFLFGHDPVAKLLLRHLVPPVAERPFGELHDVPLVDQRDGLSIVVDGVLNGHADQTLRAGFRHRLDADARVRPDALPHLALEELDHFLCFRCATRPFDPGVHVFGVLPENDDVHQFRVGDRRRSACEVPDGPHTGI